MKARCPWCAGVGAVGPFALPQRNCPACDGWGRITVQVRPSPPSDGCAPGCAARAAGRRPGHVAAHSKHCGQRTEADADWVVRQWQTGPMDSEASR